MIKNNISSPSLIPPAPVGENNETEIINWVSDGIQGLLGFIGTGTSPGKFVLYIQKPTDAELKPYYIYQTSEHNPTAYIADRFFIYPEDTIVSLRVSHDDAETGQTFYGTLLGGEV